MKVLCARVANTGIASLVWSWNEKEFRNGNLPYAIFGCGNFFKNS
jgi:hypothetical protein